MEFFKKYHKWLGIILTLFILLFSISGIVLNHRSEFSSFNTSRGWLPDDYHYDNWNNASIKASLKINADSILVYGNMGIWLTDSAFSTFSDFALGFPQGIDKRKIYKIYRTSKDDLLAATLFGLYRYENTTKRWVRNNFTDKAVVDISQKQDTILLLTRSHLYKTVDLLHFDKLILPAPQGYNNKVGLFKTLWTIHSGEIYGKAGVLFTDFIGLVFMFLSITGIIYWLAPKAVKKSLSKGKKFKRKMRFSRFSLKWHNKLGWILIPFLILSTVTGIFLRPPLLIPIANVEVGKIPYSELDTENAWFDKLRRMEYDSVNSRYIFATIDGLFIAESSLSDSLYGMKIQPPISVMGVNMFEQIGEYMFIVGSFEGLFVYNELTEEIFDYIEKKEHIPVINRGIPIGKNMVAGFTRDYVGGEVFFDFNRGAVSIGGDNPFPTMPEEIRNQPMSLWNLALEVHTMRIWKALIGIFYILLIPLSGLAILFILISGFIVWYKLHRD